MNARLLQPIPAERLDLISGDAGKQPAAGDVGETDQCFTGADGRPMVLVFFLSLDGATKWMAEAYETELELVDPRVPAS